MPGVLAWAVEGAVQWAQHGLGSSGKVDAAIARYRAETDVLERFFDEVCYFAPDAKVTRKALYDAWRTWAEDEGEDFLHQSDFTKRVAERGVVKNFEDRKLKGERIWRGLGIASDVPPSDPVPPLEKPQKSRKRKGGENRGGTRGTNSRNFSIEPSRVGGSDEKGVLVPPLPPHVSPPLSEADDPVPGPETWEHDGLTIKYLPEEDEWFTEST
jgi:phage/plasmid-associated DNA primase